MSEQKNTDPLLTPEEFFRRMNNFYLHFVGMPGEDNTGETMRSRDFYKQCLKENPETFGVLAKELIEMWRTRIYRRGVPMSEQLPEYREKLYKAYILLYPYADRNWDMFR